ncbi:MAG: hypothetical protein ACO1PI_04065 [Bacteroidota bacterium]
MCKQSGIRCFLRQQDSASAAASPELAEGVRLTIAIKNFLENRFPPARE